jgi:hypothetical protein
MQAGDRADKSAGNRSDKRADDGQDQRELDRRNQDQRDLDQRSAWLRKLDEECPYQVVLPRGPVGGDDEIMKFLSAYVGKFDMYVEDEYAVFVRYCFADPLDAAIFRSRFEHRASRFRLAG